MANFADKIKLGYIDLENAYQEIMKMENVQMDSVDKDFLELFQKQCEYMEIIIGHHTGTEPVQINFEINDDKDIIAKLEFQGRPHKELMAYKLLILTSLEDRLIQGDGGKYLLVLNLGTFIIY